MTYRLSDEDREALGEASCTLGHHERAAFPHEHRHLARVAQLAPAIEAIVARELDAAKAEHSPGETCAEADERAEENWLRAEAAEAKVAAVEALADEWEREEAVARHEGTRGLMTYIRAARTLRAALGEAER